MIIKEIKFYPVQFSLVRPFFIQGKPIETREALIVSILTDEEIIGLGEASPLPGVSIELFKKTRHDLEAMRSALKGMDMPLEKKAFFQWLSQAVPPGSICPSARFGLESALIHLAATCQNQPICNFLKPDSGKDIPVTALIQGAPSDIDEQAVRLKAQGFRSFKLKIGGKNIPLDVRKTEQLKHIIGVSSRIRLDGNSAWSADEALLFIQNTGIDQIDFFEEPCRDLQAWKKLSTRIQVPFACDEHAREWPDTDIARDSGIQFFVLKPMVFGGVSGTLALMEKIHSSGLNPVISSCFESGIGLTMLANLAALTNTAPGLGTSMWIEQDLLERPCIVNGEIPVSHLNFAAKDLSPRLRQHIGTP